MPKRTDIHKILIIGSGPIVIGQACEFDYSGTQACKALRACGYKVVLVNSNPATIMTDPVMADATYIEPLNEARLEQIIAKERPDAILPNLGGQTGLNLSMELAKKGILDKYGVKVIGVNLDAIERGEDREIFKETMQKLGIETPKSGIVHSVEAAEKLVKEQIGFKTVEIKGDVFLVNGKKINIPSYLVKAGDVIEVKEKCRASARYEQIAEVTSGRAVPSWLDADLENFKVTVTELPKRSDIDVPVDEMLIVELYSK